MSKRIQVVINDKDYVVDCVEQRCATYLDIKRVLERDGHELTVDNYFSVDDEEVNDDEAIDFVRLSDNRLELKTRKTDLIIIERGHEVNLIVPNHTTIKQLKDLYQEKTKEPLEKITYEGEELKDDRKIVQEGLSDGAQLMGHIEIVVEDKECVTARIETYPHVTLRDLLAKYKDKTRRTFPVNHARVTFDEKDLGLDDSLHKLGLEHESLVNLSTDPYSLYVKSKSREIQLEVTDDMTVRQVKDQFDSKSNENIDPEDKLRFDGKDLDDDKKLFTCYTYPKSDGDKIVLELVKMAFSVVHKYICADCGSEVRLTFKPDEAIRCHECGYRIVYKRRTAGPVQYLAR